MPSPSEHRHKYPAEYKAMYCTRFLRSQKQALAHLVDHYAKYPPTGLTMKRIVDFGKDWYVILPLEFSLVSHPLAREGDAQQSFLFLRNELPVRLASMMKEMGHLPERLLQMPSVKTVNGWYGTSLTELHTFKGLQPNSDVVKKWELGERRVLDKMIRAFDWSRFTDLLQNIRRRHSSVVETLAQVRPGRSESDAVIEF